MTAPRAYLGARAPLRPRAETSQPVEPGQQASLAGAASGQQVSPARGGSGQQVSLAAGGSGQQEAAPPGRRRPTAPRPGAERL